MRGGIFKIMILSYKTDINKQFEDYVSFKDNIEIQRIENKRRILRIDIDTVRLDYISSGEAKWGFDIEYNNNEIQEI